MTGRRKKHGRGRLAVVILYETGRWHDNDLVVMRLREFEEWLGDAPHSPFDSQADPATMSERSWGSCASRRGLEMSLGIAFKGPEGIVLAADSRVTIMTQIPGQQVTIPATFDNATKLLKVEGQEHVGVVTYGQGIIGVQEPRTAHSFLPEFEKYLGDQGASDPLSVQEFSLKLSAFFMKQWGERMPGDYAGSDMRFLVGGYDKNATYGRVFEIGIPSAPEPKEWHSDDFGPVWGGQLEYVNRLIHGFDPKITPILAEALQLKDDKVAEIQKDLQGKLQLPIPYMFLSLQDCVDLSVFLIRATMVMQTFVIGVRGVGGAIDVATVTRRKGFQAIKVKEIVAEGGSGIGTRLV